MNMIERTQQHLQVDNGPVREQKFKVGIVNLNWNSDQAMTVNISQVHGNNRTECDADCERHSCFKLQIDKENINALKGHAWQDCADISPLLSQ